MGSLLRGEQSPEQIKQFLLGYNAREATPDESAVFSRRCEKRRLESSCPTRLLHNQLTSLARVVTTVAR
jgi:anthranilate phosphoribosyltransferase